MSLAVECLDEPILTEDKGAGGRVLELCVRELALVRQAASGAESLRAARVEVRALRKAGRGREALELAEKVTPLETDAVGKARLEFEKARVLASMGRVEEALKAFEDLAKMAAAADVRKRAFEEIASLRSR
jgi:tetratricopeptide (TPR) repeat protein